jgi:hypothetical protein
MVNGCVVARGIGGSNTDFAAQEMPDFSVSPSPSFCQRAIIAAELARWSR